MIIVNGKLGTHSTNIYTIFGTKKPKIGDRIRIKSKTDQRCHKWIDAKVWDIRQIDDYYFFDCI